MTKETLRQIELDRTNDAVYTATTGVARVVIDMIRGVQQSQADRYVELVKVSGYMYQCECSLKGCLIWTELDGRACYCSMTVDICV